MVREGLDSRTFPRRYGTVRVGVGMNKHVSVIVHVSNERVAWLMSRYSAHFIFELLPVVPFALIWLGIFLRIDDPLLLFVPLPWFRKIEGTGVNFVVCCSYAIFWMLEFRENDPVSRIYPAPPMAR